MNSRVLWRYIFAIYLLPAGVPQAGAGELWSWHTFDVTVIKTPAAEVTLHGRLRTGRDLGTPQQGRAGFITKFGVRRNVTLLTGYYYGKEEDSLEDWRNLHRVFAGVEVPFYENKAIKLDTRGVLERFVVDDNPQFTRYRHRVRLRTTGRAGPYLSSEWFFDSKGYLSGRYGAGVRWRCAEGASLEFGYLFDARRHALGQARHVIVTQFSLDRLWR